MRKNYIGREQALVKHTILKTYLQRLFMIIGQGKADVINYVDCFSGPWEAEDEKLEDTSIGISLRIMSECKKSLNNTPFKRDIKFRALYIEKDPKAFNKLETFLSNNPYPEIETQCLHGDYTELLPEIVEWCKGDFTFFFVDPKGWQKVVGAKTMQPLLELKNSEFLVNMMYGFINRFVKLEHHADDMIELFGEVPIFSNETPGDRRRHLLSLYRQNIKKNYGGRTSFVAVEKPGVERVHYFLVYLTRSSIGLKVFKEAAEKMENVQRISQNEVKLRNQLAKSPIDDLFGGQAEIQIEKLEYNDNKLEARVYILNKLSNGALKIDNDVWADWLEESDLYPTDFQMAIKALFKEGLVENLDYNVSKRRTKLIHPDWPNKSERWKLV